MVVFYAKHLLLKLRGNRKCTGILTRIVYDRKRKLLLMKNTQTHLFTFVPFLSFAHTLTKLNGVYDTPLQSVFEQQQKKHTRTYGYIHKSWYKRAKKNPFINFIQHIQFYFYSSKSASYLVITMKNGCAWIYDTWCDVSAFTFRAANGNPWKAMRMGCNRLLSTYSYLEK